MSDDLVYKPVILRNSYDAIKYWRERAEKAEAEQQTAFRAGQEDMRRRAEARVFAAAMEVGLDGDVESAGLLTILQSAIASLEIKDET